MSGTVLLVDDDPAILRALGRYLTGLGYDVLSEPLGLAGVESFERHRPDVVVLDLDLPDVNGLEVLERMRERDGCVVMLTGTGDIDTAVRSMMLGAENFLTKPVELAHLGAVVGRAAEKTRLRRENAALRTHVGRSASDIDALGVSSQMRELARQVRLLAESDRTTVLLTGESGTGKGWVARLLHEMGNRADRPFVEVNCAGLTATFLDSELFGHEKGAYTDAKDRREGLFEAAHTGLLFLDEIGDLALELQPKLLKALETKTFRRLGGTREITVDVRLVAATHQDLDQRVADGTFREDLFYRLNVTPLRLPALRERTDEDRMALLHGLLGELRREIRRGPDTFSEEALERLIAYGWPGNIREMKNVLERAVIFGGDADEILPGHLPAELRRAPGGRSSAFRPESLRDVERRHIHRVLLHHDGNRTWAAKDLGIARATLINKIRAYELDV
ncbi:MAG: sigma-54 dependent transcriptional regulator [Gemmatimonadota bacterium]